MAPAMASAWAGAMNSVLAKLVILLGSEYKLLLTKDIRKTLMVFKDELETMGAVLEKLAAMEDHDPLTMEDHDPLVKGWVRQVREMTYDLEDSIDKFLHSGAQLGRAKSGIVRRAARMIMRPGALRQLSTKIQVLELRTREASERRLRYRIDDAGTSGSHAPLMNPHLPATHLVKGDLVGIERPVMELTTLLTDGQDQLKVVAIVGMGGLGKTTLAMNVYERLRQQFDCGAVVSVSQRPDMSSLLRRVLFEVGRGNHAMSGGFYDLLDERALIAELRELFYKRRYFVVIDDVWDIKAWHVIRLAFPENNLGSRILVTTRIMSIAKSCCRDNGQCIYKLEPLDISNSRALFFKRIFHSESEESCSPELIGITHKILEECQGLPLAVITMAGLLANREKSIEAWNTVSDYARPGYTLERILSTLKLSYNHLPPQLKTCLLYLSMFPEDHVIDRKRLVRRWMAEGFVSAENGLESEEVGHMYFSELITRSLIQAVNIQYDGRVDACRVHDLILNLIDHISAEENFAIRYEHEHMFGLQDKVRRLYLDCQHTSFRPSEITASHVRSLTIIGSSGQMPALENFNALRVLDLEHHGDLDRKYFKNIGRLYLLKYLRLRTTFIQLPEEIGQLQYLETLDVSGTVECELPKSVVRLKTLMYLVVNNVKLTDGLGSMQSLRELSYLKIDGSTSLYSLKELGNLSLLSNLRINWCISKQDTGMETYVVVLVSSLTKLINSKLQSLCIGTDSGCSQDFLLDRFYTPCYHLREFQMESEYYLPTVPEWMASSVNLILLRINIEVLGDDALQILGGLQALRALILMVKSIASELGLVIRSSGFKCLKQFHFICGNSWAMLMFEPGAMVILEKLQVTFSPQGQYVANSVQFSIEHLTALKHVVAVIDCENAKAKDVNAAEYAIKAAVGKHPSRPILELERLHEDLIVEDEADIIVHDEEITDQSEGENDGDNEIMVENRV